MVTLLGFSNAQQALMLEGYSIDQSGKLQYNGGGGGGFGGTSVNGQGGWIGSYGTKPGINGATYYGSTAPGAYQLSGGHSGWGGQASQNAVGHQGTYVIGAEGAILDQPTFGLFGEAGSEAFVPIANRAAGLRILPRVMKALGVRSFANGGIVGRSNISASSHQPANLIVNIYPSPGMNETDLANKVIKEVGRLQNGGGF